MTRPTPSLRSRWTRLIALVGVIPLIGALQPAQAATVLSYISSPYSWVGFGETASVTPEDGFAFHVNTSSNAASFAINDFYSNPDIQAARWWYLDFAAPLDQSLAVGTYIGAIRFPFQTTDAPGLNFSGNGRGNNQLAGSFTVLEAVYTDDGTLLSFAADFLQLDEGSSNWWNKGAIRLNSDLPISLTPEPIVLEAEFNPTPIVVLPEPIIEDPLTVEPLPEGSLIDPPIAWSPLPDGDNGEPIYWSSSGSSMVMAPPVPVMEFTTFATPGPLPIAGALVGWHHARRLRRRCRQGRQAQRNP